VIPFSVVAATGVQSRPQISFDSADLLAADADEATSRTLEKETAHRSFVDSRHQDGVTAMTNVSAAGFGITHNDLAACCCFENGSLWIDDSGGLEFDSFQRCVHFMKGVDFSMA
jgi:hypothetical protein